MRDDVLSWVITVLRAQAMPADEIEALLETADSAQVRRRLELHAERLQERLVEQLRKLSRLERLLLAELGRECVKAPALSAAGTR